MIGPLPFITLAALGGGGFFFVKGLQWMKLHRFISNIPTSRIRSLAMGLVEIEGAVQPFEKKLFTPISRKDCVYYRYTVEEYRRRGKHSQWVKIRDVKDMVPFFLKDETGQVVVDSTTAKIRLKQDNYMTSGLFGGLPAHVQSFLKQEGLRKAGFFGIKRQVRIREWYLAPGDHLYILGTAVKNTHIPQPKKNEDHLMISQGENEKIYYIQDEKENQILKNLKGWSIGGLVGGAVGILLALYLAFTFTGVL